MDDSVETPDGKWRLTAEGWLFIDSDPISTPDGAWVYENKCFTKMNENVPTKVSGIHYEDSIFMDGIDTDSPIGELKDSVVMGDINVNITKSMDSELISEMIKTMLQDMGVGLNYVSEKISLQDKERISETIQVYDSKSRSGLEFDPETDFLIANACRAAGELDDAIIRFTQFVNNYPEHNLVPDAKLCLSKIYIRKRDFLLALNELEICSELFNKAENWGGVANSMLTTGALEAERQRLTDAEINFKKAIDFSRKNKILGMEIRAMTNLGILYWQMNNLSESKSILREALVFARSRHDLESIRRIESTLSKINIESNPGTNMRNFRVNSNLIDDEFSRIDADYDEAKMHHSRKNYDLAKEGYKSCIERYEKIKSWRNIGEVHSSLGQLQEDCDDFTEAVETYSKGAEAFYNANDIEGYIHMRINLGGCLLMVKRFEDAIKYNTESFEIARENKFYQSMVDLLVNTGISRSNLGFHAEAKSDFEDAKNLAKVHSVDGSDVPNY